MKLISIWSFLALSISIGGDVASATSIDVSKDMDGTFNTEEDFYALCGSLSLSCRRAYQFELVLS